MTVVKNLFGGDSAAKEAARKSREAAAVTNDRQLAEANRNSDAIAPTRRKARGQRLFIDGPADSSTKLG